MNLYLKLFLASSIPFGIIMGVMYSLIFTYPTGFVMGLIVGLLFGIFMTLILGYLHSRSVKRMPYGKSEETMDVHHTRNIELNLSYERVYDLCLQSINSIKKCRIQMEDRSQGKIDARAGMTWKTWGDVISFKLMKIDDDRTYIEVSSKPFVITTLVDYGKNLENVETISSFIKAQANQSSTN